LIFLIAIIAIKLVWTRDVNLLRWTEKKVGEYIPSNEPQPNTYVLLVRQENSYWVDEFSPTQDGRTRAKFTLSPIDVAGDLKDAWVPIKLFRSEKYPKDVKMFSGSCYNQGETSEKNFKLLLHFASSHIVSFEPSNEERIQILNGGKPTSNFVEFLIAELLPDERQSFDIIVKGEDYPTVTAWSEKAGDVNNIYIYRAVMSSE